MAYIFTCSRDSPLRETGPPNLNFEERNDGYEKHFYCL